MISEEVFTGLIERDGIFYSDKTRQLSYPEEGNDTFYLVEDNSSWFKHRNECKAYLANQFSGHNDFWDIGGGNGFVTKTLQEGGYQAVLVELGVQGAENARKRGVKISYVQR
jgi:hypothetical protein